MKILTFIDHYLPGFKAGGPIRSVSAMVDALPREMEFWIVTRDRDFTDRQPFPGIRPDQWCDVGRAKVIYLSRWAVNMRNLARIAKAMRPDVAYVNSLFSRMSLRYLGARWLNLVPPVPIIVAPRGELSPGALNLKYLKKRTFLNMASQANLFENIIWQASSELEREEILQALRQWARVSVSPNVAVASDVVAGGGNGRTALTREPKRVGVARFVFVSRISPKKNLVHAIHLLGRLRGVAVLDIFGPIDDAAYWRECQAAIGALPSNVKVNYCGALSHDRVASAFSQREFFVFPTLGENFGHVIYESLMARCPVILSDTTPWEILGGAGAGWIIPLADEAAWCAALQACVDMGSEEHLQIGLRGQAAAIAFADRDNVLAKNVRMFEDAVHGPASNQSRG